MGSMGYASQSRLRLDRQTPRGENPERLRIRRGRGTRLRRFDVVAEVLGNTAALAEGQAAEGGESTVAPEVGGEELVATVGGRFHVSDQVTLSLGGSYDNQRAVQVHPGITLRWR